MTNTPSAKPAALDPAAQKRKPPAVRFEHGENSLEVVLSGDFAPFVQGAGNVTVGTAIINQLVTVGSHRRAHDVETTNFALGFIDAMQPRDAAETVLLAQMALTHQAAMMLARRLNHIDTLAQQDGAERAFNKLLRSYAAQMETLKRYRSKGQQVVRVERVTVESGAQAVVGTVNHGGGRQWNVTPTPCTRPRVARPMPSAPA